MASKDWYDYDIYNMEMLYRTTIENEIIGIKGEAAKLAMIPVHSGHLSTEFKYDKLKPQCYNYPYEAYKKHLEDFLPLKIQQDFKNTVTFKVA